MGIESLSQGQSGNAQQSSEAPQTESSTAIDQSGSEQGQEGQSEQRQDNRQDQRYEHIARKEREFMQRESYYKEQLKAKQEMERKLQQYEDEAKYLSSDPTKLLEKYGWNIDKLAEHLSSAHEPIAGQEKAQLYATIKELKEQNEKLNNEFKTRDERQQEERRSQTKNRLMGDLKKIATSNPDKYELVEQEGAYDTVFEVLEENYKQEMARNPEAPKLLGFEEALDIVENYIEKELEKRLSYKKVKSRFGQFENGESEEMMSAPENFDPSPRTLTSNYTQTTPPQSNRPLTREESIRRAANMLRFD